MWKSAEANTSQVSSGCHRCYAGHRVSLVVESMGLAVPLVRQHSSMMVARALQRPGDSIEVSESQRSGRTGKG